MKKKENKEEKVNIEMTSIQLDEESRILRNHAIDEKKCKRNVFPTIVLGLFVLTLITTALSVAKYATTQTSGQLASVKSNDFIWNCNLVSGGSVVGDKVVGNAINKQNNVLADSYIDFAVENCTTVNMVTKINIDTISYEITLSAGSGLKIVDLDDSMADATNKTYNMIGNAQTVNHFKVEPNGTTPGVYSGTVSVSSQSPYEKIYEQEINITLNDIAYTKPIIGGEKRYVIQNGVIGRTMEFTYHKSIVAKKVSSTAGVTFSSETNGDTGKLTVYFPPGANAEIAFAKAGVSIEDGDVAEVYY